jgi:NADPH-dependent 2,4-dienoyl-CoA reductase/sulfur reductase-like enzyme
MKFEDIPALRSPSVKWIQGSVKQIEPKERIATIQNTATHELRTENYDYLIVASGLRRVWPVVPQSLTKKTYTYETSEHIHAVKESSADGVVVVGGGKFRVDLLFLVF